MMPRLLAAHVVFDVPSLTLALTADATPSGGLAIRYVYALQEDQLFVVSRPLFSLYPGTATGDASPSLALDELLKITTLATPHAGRCAVEALLRSVFAAPPCTN